MVGEVVFGGWGGGDAGDEAEEVEWPGVGGAELVGDEDVVVGGWFYGEGVLDPDFGSVVEVVEGELEAGVAVVGGGGGAGDGPGDGGVGEVGGVGGPVVHAGFEGGVGGVLGGWLGGEWLWGVGWAGVDEVDAGGGDAEDDEEGGEDGLGDDAHVLVASCVVGGKGAGAFYSCGRCLGRAEPTGYGRGVGFYLRRSKR